MSGIAGDQQAALFGQACVEPGMTQEHVRHRLVRAHEPRRRSHPTPVDGLLTTVAWSLGDDAVTYAMEGAIFVTGAAIQWLRDGLGIIADAAETGPLAASVADTGGVVFVPAFTGLGSPWWDPYARGAIVGLTRGTTRAHIARAVVEAMAWQTADVVDAITAAAGTAVTELRVDGGAARWTCSASSRPTCSACPCAGRRSRRPPRSAPRSSPGIAEGVWSSTGRRRSAWQEDAAFAPTAPGSTGRATGTGASNWHRWHGPMLGTSATAE